MVSTVPLSGASSSSQTSADFSLVNRELLKKRVIDNIRNAILETFPVAVKEKANEVLIYQYGSAYFGADTDDSDFDICLLFNFRTL